VGDFFAWRSLVIGFPGIELLALVLAFLANGTRLQALIEACGPGRVRLGRFVPP